MLKITKATDPIVVTTITACVYAVPGVGKTSLGSTCDTPLLLDFDKGSYRSKNRRDVVQIETWEDVLGLNAADLTPYRTLVVDTAGRALDVLSAHIIKANPKMGRGGALTLQGYGELKSTFVAWTKFVRSFGLDVVLLCHSDEQRNGDELIERLDMQGGSKNEVYKASDLMGRLYLQGGKRTLNFSPTDTAFGKNPAEFAPLEVPDFATTPDYFGGVIAQTKAALNKLSAVQVAVAGLLAAWKARVDAAETAADFNALVPAGKELDERIRDNGKRILVKAARDKSIVFDAKAGAFIGGAEPEKAAAPAELPKAEEPAAREPGDDSDEDAANRAAAAPTAEEVALRGPKGDVPGARQSQSAEATDAATAGSPDATATSSTQASGATEQKEVTGTSSDGSQATPKGKAKRGQGTLGVVG